MKHMHFFKQITRVSVALMLLLAVACDREDFDQSLRNQAVYQVTLNDHEARLKALEALVKQANADIVTINRLVGALEGIASYTPLADGSGYELVMADGGKITLRHGSKGATGETGAAGADGVTGASSVVNVRLVEGTYFWTLNGELMRDAENNLIPATGEKGAQGDQGQQGGQGQQGETGNTGATGATGVTPLLRVDTDGYWETSLDGGVKWEWVKDAADNPVPALGIQGIAGLPGATGATGPQGPEGLPGANGADGEDGSITITLVDGGEAILVTFHGVSYTIPIIPGAEEPEEPVLAVMSISIGEGGLLDGYIEYTPAQSGIPVTLSYRTYGGSGTATSTDIDLGVTDAGGRVEISGELADKTPRVIEVSIDGYATTRTLALGTVPTGFLTGFNANAMTHSEARAFAAFHGGRLPLVDGRTSYPWSEYMANLGPKFTVDGFGTISGSYWPANVPYSAYIWTGTESAEGHHWFLIGDEDGGRRYGSYPDSWTAGAILVP